MTEYPIASVVEGTDDLLDEHPQDIEAEADLGVAWFMVESSPQLASSAMELITILNRCHRFWGICLPPRPVQSRQEEYRGFGTAAQGLRRDLFPLPSAGSRL